MKLLDSDSLRQTGELIGVLDEGLLKAVDFYVSRTAGVFVPRVEHCGYRVVPKHTHPAWIFIVHFNRVQVLENFETEWSDEGFTVTVIPPGFVHTELPHELNARYASIYIDKDFFAGEAALYQGEAPRTDALYSFSVDNDILNYIKEFICEYESGHPGYDRLLDCIALKLAHMMLRGMRGIKSGYSGITDRIEINKACDFIHRFYFKKLKVKDISDVAAVSESHFAHLFKKETGYSPLDYVNRIRIDKGKKLLRANSKTIAEIALEVGFSSPSHFSTVFAKFTGTTPAEFQKKGF